MAKMILGSRTPAGCLVQVVLSDGTLKPLDPRWDLRNHSPAGFEWGYGGSGPAQLALAILAEVTHDDQVALGMYQRFKEVMVARIKDDEWTLFEAAVREWICTAVIDLPRGQPSCN